MPDFRYQARGPSGQLLQGEIEAPSIDAVANQLLGNGISPVKIEPIQATTDVMATLRLWLSKSRQRVKIEDLILFCRQMYTLLSAGVPIIRSLKGLQDLSQKTALAQTLEAVVDDLEAGHELSAALGKHPKVFPRLFSSMVQVGENTGRLDEAFLQIAKYLELEKETADRVKEALRYPAFVTVAIGVAIAFISLFVVPAFEKVFKSFGADLPLATRILIAISDFAVTFWPLILMGGILGGVALRRYLQTRRGRYQWDRLKLRLPLAGGIILRATLTRFARAFSMGYGAGVPLVQALAYTALAVDNLYVGSKLEEMRNGIERGDTLTNTAAATKMFTPLVLQMLAVGEETGAVDATLQDVAEFYEREVDYDLKKLAGSIEPILVVAMGVMVLVLALGVFLPMWDLSAIAHR